MQHDANMILTFSDNNFALFQENKSNQLTRTHQSIYTNLVEYFIFNPKDIKTLENKYKKKEDQSDNSCSAFDLEHLLLSLYKLLNKKNGPFCAKLNQYRLNILHQSVREALDLISESFQGANIKKEKWIVINKTTIEKIKEDLKEIAKDTEYEFVSLPCIIEAEMFSPKPI